MFQKQLLLQCKFALLAAYEMNASLVTGDVTRTFYALQNLLNAAANISKVLWGQGGSKANERKPVRDSIGISDDSPLRKMLIRNDFEHFDERLDRWWKNSERRNFLDLSIGPLRTAVSGLDDIDRFRCFNPHTGDAMFWGTDFNLNAVLADIKKVLPTLEREATKPHWQQ